MSEILIVVFAAISAVAVIPTFCREVRDGVKALAKWMKHRKEARTPRQEQQ
jgi:hypothetical protein